VKRLKGERSKNEEDKMVTKKQKERRGGGGGGGREEAKKVREPPSEVSRSPFFFLPLLLDDPPPPLSELLPFGVKGRAVGLGETWVGVEGWEWERGGPSAALPTEPERCVRILDLRVSGRRRDPTAPEEKR